MSAERLYTPQLLAAAVELAEYPPLGEAALHGHARSATCGSSVDCDIVLGASDTVERVGLQVKACAIGQGAAAIFARHARGRSLAEIDEAHGQLVRWLEGEAALPDWPELDLIASARNFPARHAAILLPWKAALAALSSAPASS